MNPKLPSLVQLMIIAEPNPNSRLNTGLEYVPVIAISTRFFSAIDTSATKSPTQLPIPRRVRPKKPEGNSVINPIRDNVSTTKFDKNQIQIQETTKASIENIVKGTKAMFLNFLIKSKPSPI